MPPGLASVLTQLQAVVTVPAWRAGAARGAAAAPGGRTERGGARPGVHRRHGRQRRRHLDRSRADIGRRGELGGGQCAAAWRRARRHAVAGGLAQHHTARPAAGPVVHLRAPGGSVGRPWAGCVGGRARSAVHRGRGHAGRLWHVGPAAEALPRQHGGAVRAVGAGVRTALRTCHARRAIWRPAPRRRGIAGGRAADRQSLVGRLLAPTNSVPAMATMRGHGTRGRGRTTAGSAARAKRIAASSKGGA